MIQSNKTFSAFCVFLCLGLLVALYRINSTETDRVSVLPKEQVEKPGGLEDRKPKSVPKDNWKEVGGILRPPFDTIVGTHEVPDEKSLSKTISRVSRVGVSPILDKDRNANTQSVFEASDTGQHPERLSVLIEPAPFDREKYIADPQAYLDIVEPGRVFQVKAKGEARPIGELGSQFFELLQGESAVLKATADPGMPVTFYSGRLGQFSGGLAVQTVRANEQGIATATFKATPGTQGEIDIIAGSPTRSGNARFLVKVIIPDISQDKGKD